MYPQYPNQPNQPGSNPPNQYPAYPNNAPGSGPQPLRPDPYPPAPQQPSGPYGPPPSSYPPTQPSGLYPPPQPQPGQPGSYPPAQPTPASGYPPYSGAAGGPFGAPPTNPLQGYPSQPPMPPMPPKPPQRNNVLWIVLASVVAVVLIVALVGVGLVLTRGSHGTSTQTNTSTTATTAATSTPASTPTPNVPSGSDSFTDDIPSCDNPGVWNTTTGAVVKCGTSVVTITNPASSHTIAEVYFNASGSFAASYDVAVQLANITNGCGGISVLEQQAASVVGYVCSDGSWQVVQYSAAGTPTTLLKGQPGSVTVSGQINLDIVVTNRVRISINGNILGSVQHPPNEGTDSIGLVVASFTSATAASTADFDTFQYSPQ